MTALEELRTASQQAESAQRALRDDVDRLREQLRLLGSNGKEGAGEASAKESQRNLHAALSSRHAEAATPILSVTTERARVAPPGEPVSETGQYFQYKSPGFMDVDLC